MINDEDFAAAASRMASTNWHWYPGGVNPNCGFDQGIHGFDPAIFKYDPESKQQVKRW